MRRINADAPTTSKHVGLINVKITACPFLSHIKHSLHVLLLSGLLHTLPLVGHMMCDYKVLSKRYMYVEKVVYRFEIRF